MVFKLIYQISAFLDLYRPYLIESLLMSCLGHWKYLCDNERSLSYVSKGALPYPYFHPNVCLLCFGQSVITFIILVGPFFSHYLPHFTKPMVILCRHLFDSFVAGGILTGNIEQSYPFTTYTQYIHLPIYKDYWAKTYCTYYMFMKYILIYIHLIDLWDKIKIVTFRHFSW